MCGFPFTARATACTYLASLFLLDIDFGGFYLCSPPRLAEKRFLLSFLAADIASQARPVEYPFTPGRANNTFTKESIIT